MCSSHRAEARAGLIIKEGLDIEFAHICVKRRLPVSVSLYGLQVINDRQPGCWEGGDAYYMFFLCISLHMSLLYSLSFDSCGESPVIK